MRLWIEDVGTRIFTAGHGLAQESVFIGVICGQLLVRGLSVDASRMTPHEIMSYLVIGYGNPLRGDDGVGWAVVERLERLAAAAPIPLTFITRHQLLPELSDLIAQATGVLFVDAAADGEPGSIRITPLSPDPTGPASSHQMGPGVLLAYTQELYGHCPPATLITVTGESFGYEVRLSPLIESRLEAICAAASTHWVS